MAVSAPPVGDFSPTALRRARLAAGLTQQNVADALGVTIDRVNCWERGKALPHPRRIRTLATVVGIGISDLFSDPPMDDLAAHARRLVESWPELDAEQRAELRAALAPVVGGAR